MKKFHFFSKIAFSLAAFLVASQLTLAVGISPVRTELEVNPGDTKTFKVSVFNNTDSDGTMKVEVDSFSRNAENGSPIVTPLERGMKDPSDWISVPEMKFPLKANESKEVEVTVKVPKNVEPGGKYIRVMFSKEVEQITKATGVNTVGRVAHLVLIKVAGDIKISGEIERFELPTEILSDKTLPFAVVFKNTGNIHVAPTGEVAITNKTTGEKLTGIGLSATQEKENPSVTDNILINPGSGNVLPNSNRNYPAEWTQNFKNGDYTATATISYGDPKQEVTKSFDFSLKEEVKIDEFKAEVTPLKSDFLIKVTNTGTVSERLTGSISVTNAFGMEIAKIEIPKEIEYVKAGASKTFTIPWMASQTPRGLFKATLNANLGLTKAPVTAEVQFGKITITTYIIAGLVSIIILLLAFLLIKRKRDKKKND